MKIKKNNLRQLIHMFLFVTFAEKGTIPLNRWEKVAVASTEDEKKHRDKIGGDEEFADLYRSIIDPTGVAKAIIKEARNSRNFWNKVEALLSAYELRNLALLVASMGFLKDNILPEFVLNKGVNHISSYTIGILLNELGVPRVRSKVQGNLYLKSAYASHHEKAHRFFASNDNKLQPALKIVA
ncbi:hypothetical protein [Roseibium alexandrii]|uniref:hypothetical protein n=1 Tax=Roseibium alexandrii TaxID=388408 RepID=UPI003753000F